MKNRIKLYFMGRLLGISLVVLMVSACGSSGGGGGGGGGLVPTLTSISADIFAVNCTTGCHMPGGIGFTQTGSGLDLSSTAAAFASLVDVDAFEGMCGTAFDESCGKRVLPGDPDSSYLINKLEGMNLSFNTGQMPLLLPPLTPEEIDVIREWIADGALDN